jgi:O-antigen biosynthesis protein
MLRRRGHVVIRGGDWDTWDLEIRTGLLGGVRVLMTHEEHGRGRQLVRFRLWPRVTTPFWTGLSLIALSGLATAAGATLAAVVLASIALFVGARAFVDSAMATAAVRDAFNAPARTEPPVKIPATPGLDADAKGAA